MGRPTKLTDEVIQQAKDYIGDYEKHGHAMPSVVGMAMVLNIAKSTLYQWAEDEKGGFPDILGHCMDAQEFTLLNKGLDGTFNAAITKLALGKHGYSDKQATEISGPGGSAVKVQEIVFTPVGSDD